MIIVRHKESVRFEADVRGHTVPTDQTEKGGGTDQAPTPMDLIPAALGSCAALYVKRFCDARSIPTDGMRVEVSAESNKTDGFTAFHLHVVLPELPGEPHLSLLRTAVDTCPVGRTLERAAIITIRFSEPHAAEQEDLMP